MSSPLVGDWQLPQIHPSHQIHRAHRRVRLETYIAAVSSFTSALKSVECSSLLKVETNRLNQVVTVKPRNRDRTQQFELRQGVV
jgi:hypothetical protein